MAGNQKEGSSVGRITSGLAPDTLILQTINFIYNQLPVWRDDPERPHEESEPNLNPQMCKFLNFRANFEFPMVFFFHEEPQAPSRSVDFSVLPRGIASHSKYNPILVGECKRLPAPERKREKEYVSGTGPKNITGGIQRFKLGLHSGGLSSAVMVGYIQKQNAEFWHKQINNWICEFVKQPNEDGCTWTEDETLEFIEECPSRGVSKCASDHKRSDSSRIKICHLWINMSSIQLKT